MQTSNNPLKFVLHCECGCTNHIIIECEDWDLENKNDPTFAVSFQPTRKTFWERLKFLFHPDTEWYTDLVLKPEDINILQKWIKDCQAKYAKVPTKKSTPVTKVT